MKFSAAIFASAVAALAAAPSAMAFAPAVSQVHKTASASAGVASLPAATKLFMSDEVGFHSVICLLDRTKLAGARAYLKTGLHCIRKWCMVCWYLFSW